MNKEFKKRVIGRFEGRARKGRTLQGPQKSVKNPVWSRRRRRQTPAIFGVADRRRQIPLENVPKPPYLAALEKRRQIPFTYRSAAVGSKGRLCGASPQGSLCKGLRARGGLRSRGGPGKIMMIF